jgi:hypothetical protein
LRVFACALLTVSAFVPETIAAQDRLPSGTSSLLCSQPERVPLVVRPFNLVRATPSVGPWHAWAGTIHARLAVGTDGTVLSVEQIASKAPQLYLRWFSQEAQRMRFAPAMRDCQPVVGSYLLTVRYRED